MKKIVKKLKHFLNNKKQKILSVLFYKKNKKIFKDYRIMSDEETIDKIINEGYSLARFGDGEFKWMLGVKQNTFQKDDERLSKKLKECMQDSNAKIIIGIPRQLKDLRIYNEYARKYWMLFLQLYGKETAKLIPINRNYANTNITRFYMDYKNKENSLNKINNLRRIWNDRDVIIIEGEKTKIGVGNDLMDNAKTIKRIIAPSINAFDKYDEIISETKKQNKESLILISLRSYCYSFS